MTYYSFPGLRALERKEYSRLCKEGSIFTYKERFERIVEAIEKATGFSLEDIMSDSREGELPIIRALIAEELHRPGFIGYSLIGRLLNKDHTTIRWYILEKLPSIVNSSEFKLLKRNVHMYL